ncbi:MAG: hypothetical protein KGO02_26015 [Alphaproteobacteria bacterium]|nr:hypothetical protein [Alphaproteobacteria bacterium]
MSKTISLTFENFATGTRHCVEGQEARTLLALYNAGAAGLTALEVSNWALRLSHYVYKLRALGLSIDMEREQHGGPIPGRHGRYFLRSGIRIINTGRAAA